MACLKLQVPKMVTKSKKVKFQKLMQLVPILTCFQYIMNPLSVTYSEPWIIQKPEGIYILTRNIVKPFEKSSGL